MIRIFELTLSNQLDFYDSLSIFNPQNSLKNKSRLTDRELQIAEMVCREYSSEQIATSLNLSVHTINTHRKNILKKIDAKNAIDLMNYLKSLEE